MLTLMRNSKRVQNVLKNSLQMYLRIDLRAQHILQRHHVHRVLR